MSDTWVGPGWWLASDGRWYPPQTEHSHAAAVDEVLALRESDQPFVLDLRHTTPIVSPSPSATTSTHSAEPVEPTQVEPVKRAMRAPVPVRSSSSGDRWGGHRRVATPVRSRTTD